MSLILAVLIAVAGQIPSDQTASREPSRRLDPAYPHIEIFLEEHVPQLRFFANPALAGAPIVEVNERGLFNNGRLACAWPGGAYNVTNATEMVLGYADPKATRFIGCTPGAPIRSFWYEEYGRYAKLYIEVIARGGSIVEARCSKRRCYLDLNELRGDPRENDPSFAVKLKGETGWVWWISGREADARDRAERARLRRDVSLQTFLRNARQCLASSTSPACFAAFVKDQIYYPEAQIGIGMVTPDQFVQAVWSSANSSGDTPWKHLVECFARARGDSMRLEANGWMCDLEKVGGAWKVVHFSPGC